MQHFLDFWAAYFFNSDSFLRVYLLRMFWFTSAIKILIWLNNFCQYTETFKFRLDVFFNKWNTFLLGRITSFKCPSRARLQTSIRTLQFSRTHQVYFYFLIIKIINFDPIDLFFRCGIVVGLFTSDYFSNPKQWYRMLLSCII